MYYPKINLNPISEINDILNQCKGDLSSKILVISEQWEDNKENAQLQINIFKAIGFSYPQDFLVLSITNTTYFKLIDLLESTQIDFVMTFGVPLNRLCLQYESKDFQVIQVKHVKVITSCSFKALQESKANKAALWSVLKDVFK